MISLSTLKLLIFFLGTLGLALVSPASLRDPRSHGFYRFFAWEAILALLLLNIDQWFIDPYSPPQLVSWLLLIVSLVFVVDGVRLLRLAGKPSTAREDPSLVTLEKTTRLVRIGVYRWIRHPLYSSLIFLAWGIFFKDTAWASAALVVLATVFLTVTARIEEGENLRYFGEEYRAYMRQTKRFVPYLY